MKLKGKAKAAFLRRMAKGRRKPQKQRKSKPRKVLKQRKASQTMARRRSFKKSYRRYSRGASGIVNKVRNGPVGEAAKGIGMARIAEQVTGRIAPQYTKYAKLAGAYVGGGLVGVGAEIAYESLTGQGGILSQVGGGDTIVTESF